MNDYKEKLLRLKKFLAMESETIDRGNLKFFLGMEVQDQRRVYSSHNVSTLGRTKGN